MLKKDTKLWLPMVEICFDINNHYSRGRVSTTTCCLPSMLEDKRKQVDGQPHEARLPRGKEAIDERRLASLSENPNHTTLQFNFTLDENSGCIIPHLISTQEP